MIIKDPFQNLIGESAKFKNVIRIARKAAEVDVPVLIQGETGTGKDLLAQAIHFSSKRNNQPFRAINCASISISLAEAELFGYEKGSFTGADKNGKAGLFEQADKGSLFLDEIGEMPVELQKKLLRVLENKTIRRVGGNREIPVDVRLICATNCLLSENVKKGVFREDFYFRICVMDIELPPLREREEDMVLLAEYYMNSASERYGKSLQGLSEEFQKHLRGYSWPGNIRQLKHTIEKEVIFSPINEDKLNHIPDWIMEERVQENFNLKYIEEITIRRVLRFTRGNMKKTSELLGISKATLYRKREEYGI